MNFTAWLDVAIGLSVVYLGASLFVTIVHEYIQHLLNSRGNNLAKNVRQLIDDPAVQAQLKQSPTLAPFFEESSDWLKLFRKAFRGMPSYVDPVLLARLLLA